MKIENLLLAIQKNISLRNYTTFKIGGKAKYFFIAKRKEDLIKAISVAKKLNLPFFVFGGGSNVLVSDRGFKGLVIKFLISNFQFQNGKIFCEAGTPLAKLVQFSIEKSLTGLEWAVGIPGTVGGAVYGNAGAFGSSMADIVKSVEVLQIANYKLQIANFKNRDCKFSYRDSIFKHANSLTLGLRPRGVRIGPCECPNLIILSAEIRLKKGKKSEIERKIKEYLNYRKETQPLNFPSAGSIFKNPLPAKVSKKFRRARKFSAAELIEKCGLKGKKIGNVKISEKHANFIINLGNGKAKDVIKLINLVKQKVKEKFGITLEEEIQYLGFKN